EHIERAPARSLLHAGERNAARREPLEQRQPVRGAGGCRIVEAGRLELARVHPLRIGASRWRGQTGAGAAPAPHSPRPPASRGGVKPGAGAAPPRYSVRTTESRERSPSRCAIACSTYASSFDSSVSLTAYSGSPIFGYEPSSSSGKASSVVLRCSAIVPSPSF